MPSTGPDTYRSLDIAIGTEVRREMLACGQTTYNAICSACGGTGTLNGHPCRDCQGEGSYLREIS